MINGLTFVLSFMQQSAYPHRMKNYSMLCINLDNDCQTRFFYSGKRIELFLNLFFDTVQFVNLKLLLFEHYKHLEV